MPDEAREFALLCPHCGEGNPPDFPVCWNCQRDLPDKPRSAVRPPAAASATAPVPLDPLAQAKRRKRLAIELGVVGLVLWGPMFVGGFWGPRRSETAVSDLFPWSLEGASILALVGYLVWIDGDARRLLGLQRPGRVELAWGFAVWVGMVLTGLIGETIGVGIGFDSGPSRGPYTHQALWFMPLVFLLWAFVEEVLYRAYLFRRLKELLHRPGLAIAISSLLFALSHGYRVPGTLAVFLSGLFLGWMFRMRGSLWALVLGHWVYNMVVTYT